MYLQAYATTTTGNFRKLNQDAFSLHTFTHTHYNTSTPYTHTSSHTSHTHTHTHTHTEQDTHTNTNTHQPPLIVFGVFDGHGVIGKCNDMIVII